MIRFTPAEARHARAGALPKRAKEASSALLQLCAVRSVHRPPQLAESVTRHSSPPSTHSPVIQLRSERKDALSAPAPVRASKTTSTATTALALSMFKHAHKGETFCSFRVLPAC
mmetsp:Transcript_31514/g.102673  ORF Transcript_31514/g.102673 Transcript_31514/m.102673 type:complete len:114 (-) Transcript_31514:53-394(-)